MNSPENIMQKMSELNVSPQTIQDEINRLESELKEYFGPILELYAEA
jgi:predicted DNA-binding protein YlxM (UPF0122 family)